MAAHQKGEDRQAIAVIGDGTDRRHGVRGAQQRWRARRPAAGDPERQRHVDQPAGRRAEPLPGPAHERALLLGGQASRQSFSFQRLY